MSLAPGRKRLLVAIALLIAIRGWVVMGSADGGGFWGKEGTCSSLLEPYIRHV